MICTITLSLLPLQPLLPLLPTILCQRQENRPSALQVYLATAASSPLLSRNPSFSHLVPAARFASRRNFAHHG